MSTTYRRVILKLSGELMRTMDTKDMATIDHGQLEVLCREVFAPIHGLKIQLGIVLGGGNIFRGHTYNGRNSGFNRNDADRMGMLATAINAIALRSALAGHAIEALIQSSMAIEGAADRFSLDTTEKALNSGKMVIFCGGTGHPYFSTDSAAALRACELQADALLKASTVDGIYDCDPRKNSNARKFDRLTYREVLEKNLHVMDLTALTLCMENHIPIRVFSGQGTGEIFRAIQDPLRGTFIGEF